MNSNALVTRRYTFEAAHFLPKVPDGHKCKRPHGHNYEIDVSIYGSVDEVGFVIDFWDLDKIVEPLVAMVDHRMLNDIAGLENPTAEYIGRWFVDGIKNNWPAELRCSLMIVRIYETKNCWVDVYAT